MLSSLERSKSTRRTATVTTSAPDASSARIISSCERYLPVPTSRREWNTRPPMVRGMSFTTSRAVVIGSPSSYEMHQLDGIARGDAHVAQRRPAHDAAVVLHHHGTRVEFQCRQELEQRRAVRDGAPLAVHHDLDRLTHPVNPSSICRAAASGSSASHRPRIAATPYAPAARTAAIRAGVMPPIATTGRPSAATPASPDSPSGVRSGWLAVGNTVPTKR